MWTIITCWKTAEILLRILLVETLVILATPVDHHAKLVLIDDKNQRFELSGRRCYGGVYIVEPKKLQCACVFGVWGLYGKYCEKPIAIIAGENVCFKIPKNLTIHQFIIFGNSNYPFEPTITHFSEGYKIFTHYYAVNTLDLDLDPFSPFLTITSHFWEIESDTGEKICLIGERTKSRKQKQFCYFNSEYWSQGQSVPWKLIVKIKKGCHSNSTKQYSTNCVNIPSKPDFQRQNGIEVCNGPEITLFGEDQSFSKFTAPSRQEIEETTLTPEEVKPPQDSSVLIDFPNMTITNPPPILSILDFPLTTENSSTQEKFKSTEKSVLIDFENNLTTNPPPILPILDFPLTRENSSTQEKFKSTEKSVLIDFENNLTTNPPPILPILDFPLTTENSSTQEKFKSTEKTVLIDFDNNSTTDQSPIFPLLDFSLTIQNSTQEKFKQTERLIDFSNTTKINSSSLVPLLDFSMTPAETTTSSATEVVYFNTCVSGIRREDVMAHWAEGARNCPMSPTNAIFINQLERFAIEKMNKIFDTRLKSLHQITQLLNFIFILMTKTCPTDAVSPQFLEDTTEAFTMFIKEDFFYGVEELETHVYARFKKALQKCIKRAKVFNVSMEPMECSTMEITGKLVTVGGKLETIEIPIHERSKDYEPVIESVWKMFLNAHSYCYADFEQINDHHHFSTLFFSIFSESIYEKWISPLESEELYRFITPNTENLGLTMRNLDYCVGATSLITTCQTWLHRNSFPTSDSRKKRSAWGDHMQRAREETSIWNGTGHCLQSPEEPAFKLGYGKCSHPLK